MARKLIDISHISKSYGDNLVLDDLNLYINENKFLTLLGPSGCGKTTTLRIIGGFETPDKGKVIFDGQDITDMSITDRAKLGISYAFQQPVRFKGLTVRDLITLAAGGELEEETVCQVLGQVGLCTRDYIDREVNASLSGGEIKRIEIATVLARKDRRLAVFDEPEAGIDLWSFNGLVDAFSQLKAKQTESLLIISHQERLLEIADEIVVVADGKIRMAGPGQEVLPRLLEGEKASRCPWGKEEGR